MVERGHPGLCRIAAALEGIRSLPAAEREAAWATARRLLDTERVIAPERLRRVLITLEDQALAADLAPRA